MPYRGSYKLHRPNNVTYSKIYDIFAQGLYQIIKKRERKGLFGAGENNENVITVDMCVKWLENIGLQNKFIWRSDKTHSHYSWFLYDSLYPTIMGTRIRNADDFEFEEDYKQTCGNCKFYNKKKEYCKKNKLNISKDEICNEYKEIKINIYYLPEIIYLDKLRGYIITKNIKDVDKYKDERSNKLLSQQTYLEKRCNDTLKFINQLPKHHQDFLDNKDRDKDVA